MRAKDLMMGDWVKAGGINRVVSSISDNIVLFDTKTICCSPVEDVNPIQITEEFLLKNGFEKTRESPLLKSFRLILSESDEGEEVLLIDMRLKENRLVFEYIDRGYGRCAINLQDACVHQLQHILRLCNIDFEIEL